MCTRLFKLIKVGIHIYICIHSSVTCEHFLVKLYILYCNIAIWQISLGDRILLPQEISNNMYIHVHVAVAVEYSMGNIDHFIAYVGQHTIVCRLATILDMKFAYFARNSMHHYITGSQLCHNKADQKYIHHHHHHLRVSPTRPPRLWEVNFQTKVHKWHGVTLTYFIAFIVK